MVGAADPKGTIGECSKRCYKLFSQGADIVCFLPHDNASRVRTSFEDEFARFKLWASNIGVFAEVHASLDFRVRELPDVKELFLRQLDTIEYRLDQLCEDVADKTVRKKQAVGGDENRAGPVTVSETEEPNNSFEKWDLAETLQSIHESIDWLHRLSNWVRKASFVNQNKRAEVFLWRDSEGFESKKITEQMTADLKTLYTHFIERTCKGLENYLSNRLIETMITRHKRILHRRYRQDRWTISQVHYVPRTVEALNDFQRTHTPEKTPFIPQPSDLIVTPRPTKVRVATPQEKSATTVDVDIYRKATARSRLSRATSAPWRRKDRMLVPPPPRAASKEKDFVCPYCCLILSSREALNWTTWAEHVKKDLDAYICVFEDCDSPFEIYSSSKEWLSHMSLRHRMRWQCFATDHEPLLCDRSEDFENHMKTNHAGSFPASQLPFILEISAQPITPTLEHCPFCSWLDGDIEAHVGGHLREFALHSLPWPDDGGGQSDDANQSDTINSKESTRETIREARNSLPPFENDETESEDTSEFEADRPEEYGFLPNIVVQHEPLHDDLELLQDKHIEAFVCNRYKVASKEALILLLSTQLDKGPPVNIIPHRSILSTQPDYLLDDLLSNILHYHARNSTFDSSMRKFIPEGTLDIIINKKSIFEAMAVEELNGEDDSLAEFILAEAKKTFAISVYIGLEDAKLRRAMVLCKDRGFTDQDLPSAYTQSSTPAASSSNQLVGDSTRVRLANLEVSVDRKRRVWTDLRIDKFCEEQWTFLAPVFSTTTSNHDLSSSSILPFTKKYPGVETGAFGHVCKYEIHPAHFKDPLNPELPSPEFLAVKEMHLGDKTAAHWEKEVRTLVMMNSLNQDHIVRFITAFSRRRVNQEDYCLIFEWANGGNLRDLWKTIPKPNLQPSFVKAIIKQLLGLAKALCAAHYLNSAGASIRHGDLKPENILWFRDLDEIGRLKIGDWGISKQNNVLTEMRSAQTTSQWGTQRYAAPEVETGVRGMPKRRSRLYDIWAMGCITLEFIIWLLYGWDEVKRFKTCLGGERVPFYEISRGQTGKEVATVHKVVVQWMEHMEKDPACHVGTTALGDLLEVVKTGLLVVNLPRRMGANQPALQPHPSDQLSDTPASKQPASLNFPLPSIEVTGTVRNPHAPEPDIGLNPRILATDLQKRLENILVGDDDTANYWCTDLPRLPPPDGPKYSSDFLKVEETEYITEPTGLSNDDHPTAPQVNRTLEIQRADYAHPKLDNDWQIHVDNRFASSLLTTLKSSGSYEVPQAHEAISLCSQCKDFRDDLWRPGFSVTYDVPTIQARATLKECDLCGLFWRTCERHGCTELPTVQFYRVGSSLKINGSSKIVLSLFRSPDLKTGIDHEIQIGLAELPEAGKSAHLDVIQEWLHNCDAKHKHSTCQPPKDEKRLPTRLIDVGQPGDTYVRLRETRAIDTGEWIALSHPWGIEPLLYTTRRNLEELTKGIGLKALPTTFKDAVIVTRALGCRYLWIDAICIIQGPDGDFFQEASRIEEVFSGAYCVLAASRAEGQNSGFLQARNKRDYVALHRENEAPFYICDMIDDFGGHVLDGALNQRAWILMEHALARRTIFFTEHQTYWECGEGVRCETGTRMTNNVAALLGDPNFPQLLQSAPYGERILRYQDLYATYSRLKLTNPTDRPLAIGALERRILRAMEVGGSFGVFDQGPNKGLLCRSLLWHRGDDTTTLQRIQFHSDRTVPSWSWMAYTGGIDFLSVEFGQVEWEDVRSPWSESRADVKGAPMESIDLEERNVKMAIRAVAREYDTLLAAVEEGNLVFDIPGGSQRLRTKCVVLGRVKRIGRKEDQVCYLLVVAKMAGLGRNDQAIWERVGAGFLPGRCIAPGGEEVEIC